MSKKALTKGKVRAAPKRTSRKHKSTAEPKWSTGTMLTLVGMAAATAVSGTAIAARQMHHAEMFDLKLENSELRQDCSSSKEPIVVNVNIPSTQSDDSSHAAAELESAIQSGPTDQP